MLSRYVDPPQGFIPARVINTDGFPYSQNTIRRSALRITRESELLGGQLTAYHTRESLVLEAKFLREDLPYFTELLGEVLAQTKYTGELSIGYGA